MIIVVVSGRLCAAACVWLQRRASDTLARRRGRQDHLRGREARVDSLDAKRQHFSARAHAAAESCSRCALYSYPEARERTDGRGGVIRSGSPAVMGFAALRVACGNENLFVV